LKKLKFYKIALFILSFVFLAEEEFDKLCFEFGVELDDVVNKKKYNFDESNQFIFVFFQKGYH
jgi:hypothetical protein